MFLVFSLYMFLVFSLYMFFMTKLYWKPLYLRVCNESSIREC